MELKAMLRSILIMKSGLSQNMQRAETTRNENFRARRERNNWRTKVHEEVTFRVQPVESAERAHFGNFALISHTRFAVWSKSRILPGRNELARFGYLSRALNQFSKISPVISWPGEKQMPRVATSGIYTCIHTRARLECSRKRVRLYRGDGNRTFSFSSFLTRSRASCPSRFLSLSLSFFLGHPEQAVDYADPHAECPQCERI